MAKLFLVVFITIISSFNVKSQDTAKIVAQAQIIKISETESIKANENVQQFISATDKANSFFDRFVIIGPRLWGKIKDLPEFKNIMQGDVTFKVPKLKKDGSWTEKEDMTAKALQLTADFSNFCKYLQTSLTINKTQIVDLNLTEKFIYWQYFAKIEEGARAVQVNNTRLVLQFVKDKLFFIELTAE